MSRLDAALRRAAAEGVLDRNLRDMIIPEPAQEPVTFVSEKPAERPREPHQAVRTERPLKDRDPWTFSLALRTEPPPLTSDYSIGLPPHSIGSQLGNLVQALELHPDRPRSVAFISSQRREGTSTCMVNLGAYLSSRHAKVVLVDANTHNPALHKLTKLRQAEGLADVVTGDLGLDAVLKPTAIPSLFAVTSGECQPGAHGLLPSRVRETLAALKRDFDFVLVDCPAVNAYGDAAVTAAVCDTVVLVFESGRTPREAAQASKTLLTRANCNVFGVFMNKRKFYIPKFLYDRL